jgi:tetratricopeptide (TPR) repeat protein
MISGPPVAPPPPPPHAIDTTASPVPEPPPCRTDYVGIVAGFREEARTHYLNSDYCLSILTYTTAIQAFGDIPQGQVASDTLAVLYSNRAAAFMMIGAHAAAQSDCEMALPHVSPPGPLGENYSNESSDPLKTKLFTRLGRALLKQGDHRRAISAFEQAMILADSASNFSRRVHEHRDADVHSAALGQMSVEASISKKDATNLEETMTKIARFMNTETASQSRSDLAATLGHVNLALGYASGCVSLYETKLILLGKMKRWREVAGVCERLAAENTKLDGVFVGNPALEVMNPFPGATTRAAYLVPTFFGESSEEDALTADLKLSAKAAGEAALRLPASLTSFYLRALRLEERYPAADQALSALEIFVRTGTARFSSQELHSRFHWLPLERDKWNRTKKCREIGDELFRDANFDGAAAQYGSCLAIDSENRPADGTTSTTPSVTTGGRLHAVLHCNRAACLMATNQYSDALAECSNALNIHSRYMKAMLRRARCYTRLSRAQEAQSEYRRWLALVEEAKKSPRTAGAFVPPCLFDGPGDVTDVDITTVHSELKTLLENQRKAEAATRDEAARRQERQRWQEGFASARAADTTAQQRQEQWRSQQNDTRRWDSFRSRGPRASSASNVDSGSGHLPRRGASADDTSAHQQQPCYHQHRRTGSWGQQESDNAQQQQQQQQQGHSTGSVGSPPADDYYAILRLQPDASEADIKKAYRGLARQYHPDRNRDDPTAHGRFLKLKTAYDTLVDDNSRRNYDRSRRNLRRYG